MAIQAEIQTLEEIPETIRINEEEKVIVFVEGRKPRCFNCGMKGHIRAECQPKPQETSPPESTPDKSSEATPNRTPETAPKETRKKERCEENEKEERWSTISKKMREKQKTETTPHKLNLKRRKESVSTFMAIKASNNRLVNRLAAMSTNKSSLKNRIRQFRSNTGLWNDQFLSSSPFI
ncbi:XP_029640472.1uncharacterized protein LOC115215450 [Octopus vulgaris]|uniref:XP_029640472.1uncharacterized protein LOC115215450 n=1 Tax=Octopus vulgaris TaxID=6645 RepID=A0AA36F699_OCTVU|nr:XP_029640472.1uncharacterized protein LOC115215450 [Octopus vulgaris]